MDATAGCAGGRDDRQGRSDPVDLLGGDQWRADSPACDDTEHYDLKSRPVRKCKACTKQFRLTPGTIFHSRKLSLRDILGAIAIFTNGAKGYSALQLSRDLGCDYKAAFVLLHKLRESIKLAC